MLEYKNVNNFTVSFILKHLQQVKISKLLEILKEILNFIGHISLTMELLLFYFRINICFIINAKCFIDHDYDFIFSVYM